MGTVMNSNGLLSPHSCCIELLLDAKRSLMVVTHRGPAVLWCLPPLIWIKALGGNAREQRAFPAEFSHRSVISAPLCPLTHHTALEGETAHRFRHLHISTSGSVAKIWHMTWKMLSVIHRVTMLQRWRSPGVCRPCGGISDAPGHLQCH